MADPIAASNSSTDAQNGMFGQIMRRRTIHFIALFILVYVGLEVTIGGWIVTYIISERGGGPSSGMFYTTHELNGQF
jgi:fucose permease